MLLLVFALTLSVSQLSAEIIPLDRRIVWSPGVRGGIPSRTHLINVRHAPYNAKGDGITDDRPAIQNAINAATSGQVVYLPQGTYQIGSSLIFNKGITLRGDGPDKTTIDYTGSSGIDILVTERDGWTGDPIAITSANTKDSMSITVSSASDISVNDYVVISQLNVSGLVNVGECDWCGNDDPSRVMAQVNKVLAKSGDTLTLERPLYYNYANSPAVTRSDMVEKVGFEDFLLRRSHPSARSGNNLYLDHCANCWVSNVESQMAGHTHVQVENSYACTVRDSWFSDGHDHGPGRSYGIFLFAWNSDHLIENNVIHRCRHSLGLEGGGSGNVFGYNYSIESLTEPHTNWLTEEMNTHGAHPFMNLFEGNVVGKLSHDNTWGSASHNTTFRCWIQNYSSNAVALARWAVDVEANSYYNNIVGSIIGRPGDTGDRYAAANISETRLASYRLGFQSPGSGTISDPNVQPRTLIHGNYDYIGGEVVWEPSHADRNLPSSLYLSTKPAWFGSLAWPVFGPDLIPMVSPIPAQVRYEGGTVE